MKQHIIILLIILFGAEISKSCNSCGGGTGDLSVLSLDGLALFNIGFTREQFTGYWDKNGKWLKNNHSQSQNKISFNAAYRLNKNFQFAVSLPFIINTSSIPDLKQSGSGFGDINIGGRFELFHEFQPKKKGKKLILDRTLPYLAITFGLMLPTGKSDETAKNDVDITGKGFYSTLLGISVTKSIVKQKFQILADFSWQHSFKKNYKTYFGEPLNGEFSKQQGEKFNYSVTANYIINNYHALALSVTGFLQNNYKLNNSEILNTNERTTNFSLSYTYYPSIPFRITTAVKLGLPENNIGVNSQGSNLFNINFTYYIAQ